MEKPAPATEIRAATVEDRGPLVRLLTASAREAGLAVPDDSIARAVELALAPRSSAWLVVARRGGVHVGALLANPAVSPRAGGGVLLVDELYVAALYRRRGVGRALLDFTVAEARLLGIAAIELAAPLDGEAAAALARGAGFVVDARRWWRRSS